MSDLRQRILGDRVSLTDAARELGCSVRHLQNVIARRDIPTIKPSRMRFVRVADLQAAFAAEALPRRPVGRPRMKI